MIELVDVYAEDPVPHTTLWFLFDMLRTRPDYANISHRAMPAFSDHVRFVKSRPYTAWYIVRLAEGTHRRDVGVVYLSKLNEIGVGVRAGYRGNGHGEAAVRALMEKHPRAEFFANIAPGNEGSQRFFQRLGFGHISNTYRLEAK